MTDTNLADIKLGAMLFRAGIAFDKDDLNTKANAQSQARSESGKGKHPMVVINKTDTGIVVAGVSTMGGASALTGTVKAASLPHWIPIRPKTKESGMKHEPIDFVDTDGWIYVRKSITIEGSSFKILQGEQTLETVNIVRAALGMEAAASV